tara:strand:- start:132705 stop:133739 length:1035 start_codon:yes stop_codon:yes gene_type:complete
MNTSYTDTKEQNPHASRSRQILKKYPEVRSLLGPNLWSGPLILAVVALQFAIGYLMQANDISWWWIVFTAFFIGAFASHSLFVMLHEACHDLVAKSKTANKVWGIICNIPQGFPSALGFRTFHLLHHAHMSEYDYDADLANHWEAKLVKNIWWRKALWFVFFMFVEGVRPSRLKKGKVLDTWTFFNILIVIVADILIFFFLGPKVLGYLMISTFFSIGLHPVGARWIQEHYVYKEGQETYSYYGILNRLSFNVGYHNEHHDLYKIPWNNLPKLKAMAPEFYDNLYAHTSWTKLILNFIFNPKMDLYSRITRQSIGHHKVKNEDSGTYETKIPTTPTTQLATENT